MTKRWGFKNRSTNERLSKYTRSVRIGICGGLPVARLKRLDLVSGGCAGLGLALGEIPDRFETSNLRLLWAFRNYFLALRTFLIGTYSPRRQPKRFSHWDRSTTAVATAEGGGIQRIRRAFTQYRPRLVCLFVPDLRSLRSRK